MTTLIWNVRGARRRVLQGHLKHLLHAHNPSMVILLETKVKHVANNRTFKLLSNHLSSNVVIPGTVHNRGLWVCLDPLRVQDDLIQTSTQHITLYRSCTSDKVTNGLFTAIYASPN